MMVARTLGVAKYLTAECSVMTDMLMPVITVIRACDQARNTLFC